MTYDEFKQAITRMSILESAYSIEEDENESYVMIRNCSNWIVFYSERGVRRRERSFPSEGQAYDYLLELLESDSAARRT